MDDDPVAMIYQTNDADGAKRVLTIAKTVVSKGERTDPGTGLSR